MISIADIDITFTPTVTTTSNRNQLLKDLYSLYISQPEINRKENRKRYHAWVRRTHPEVCKKAGFSKELYDSFKPAFKKAKLSKEEKFLKYITEDRFWFWFSHVDRDGLEKLISEARDASWREFNVAQLIMGSVKYVENYS